MKRLNLLIEKKNIILSTLFNHHSLSQWNIDVLAKSIQASKQEKPKKKKEKKFINHG